MLLYISRSVLLRMRNVSDKSLRGKKTHFGPITFFFRKSCRLWDNVEKYCRARQATDDSMAQCMPDNQSYAHTLRICNTYCFPIVTMVARTRLNVMLYVHCLSCVLICRDLRTGKAENTGKWNGLEVGYTCPIITPCFQRFVTEKSANEFDLMN